MASSESQTSRALVPTPARTLVDLFNMNIPWVEDLLKNVCDENRRVWPTPDSLFPELPDDMYWFPEGRLYLARDLPPLAPGIFKSLCHLHSVSIPLVAHTVMRLSLADETRDAFVADENFGFPFPYLPTEWINTVFTTPEFGPLSESDPNVPVRHLRISIDSGHLKDRHYLSQERPAYGSLMGFNRLVRYFERLFTITFTDMKFRDFTPDGEFLPPMDSDVIIRLEGCHFWTDRMTGTPRARLGDHCVDFFRKMAINPLVVLENCGNSLPFFFFGLSYPVPSSAIEPKQKF